MYVLCKIRLLETLSGCRMYGLIFENLRQYIITVYGEDKWEEIRRQARVEQPSFTTHDIYPDNIVHRIVAKSCKVSLFMRLTLLA